MSKNVSKEALVEKVWETELDKPPADRKANNQNINHVMKSSIRFTPLCYLAFSDTFCTTIRSPHTG